MKVDQLCGTVRLALAEDKLFDQRTKGATAVSLSSVHPSSAEVMQGSAEGGPIGGCLGSPPHCQEVGPGSQHFNRAVRLINFVLTRV
jgi:hypothetical protein